MARINISELIRNVYGAKGMPYPDKTTGTKYSTVADPFPDRSQGSSYSSIARMYGMDPVTEPERSRKGTPLWGKNLLGRPVFLPVTLDGVTLQNPIISISGEKAINEIDIVGVGTVFEKVFTKPYDISIICSIISKDDTWPEEEIIKMYNLWSKDAVLTIECALTDIYLQPKNNFVLFYKDIFEMTGTENVQIIQFSGRSNIDFELEIIE
jgi:hypothetical protein